MQFRGCFLCYVKYLVNFTEDLNALNDDGKTPADMARKNRQNHIVTFLENYNEPK